MATKPKKACKYARCSKVTTAKHGYCPEHKRLVDQDYEKKYRKPRPKRYSTRQWQDIRKLILGASPWCVDPFTIHKRYDGNIRVRATEVDHIDGNPDNQHEDNLQALCKSCHSRKTVQEQGRFGKKGEVYSAPYSRRAAEGAD